MDRFPEQWFQLRDGYPLALRLRRSHPAVSSLYGSTRTRRVINRKRIGVDGLIWSPTPVLSCGPVVMDR